MGDLDRYWEVFCCWDHIRVCIYGTIFKGIYMLCIICMYMGDLDRYWEVFRCWDHICVYIRVYVYTNIYIKVFICYILYVCI